MDTIASLLSNARTERRLSVTAAAKEVDVTHPTYYSWKRGAQPDLDNLDRIARSTAEPRERILEVGPTDSAWLAPTNTSSCFAGGEYSRGSSTG